MIASPVFGLGEEMGGSATPSSSDASDAVSSSSSDAAAACGDEEIIPPGGRGGMMTESQFRLLLNADACATAKLAEGLQSFIGDTNKLEGAIRAKVQAKICF